MTWVSITAKGNAGATVEVGPIDIDLLNKQKQELIATIWEDKDNILWGIVCMLDDICDAIRDE